MDAPPLILTTPPNDLDAAPTYWALDSGIAIRLFDGRVLAVGEAGAALFDPTGNRPGEWRSWQRTCFGERKGKSAIGKPILSLADGARLHEVKDVILGAGNDTVVGLLADEGEFLRARSSSPSTK